MICLGQLHIPQGDPPFFAHEFGNDQAEDSREEEMQEDDPCPSGLAHGIQGGKLSYQSAGAHACADFGVGHVKDRGGQGTEES